MTEPQTSLFDPPAEIQRPSQPTAGRHHRNPKRSELAGALAAVPKAGTQRAKVLEALVRAGQTGMTRNELVAHLGLPINIITGRVNELIGKDKPVGSGIWARETGKERIGPSGLGNAIVYATDRGERWVKNQRGERK